MKDTTLIKLQIENLGFAIQSQLAVNHKDIEKYVQEGIERASENIKETIILESQRLAIQQVNKEIENYFKYGEGCEAIHDMVKENLNHLLKKVKP